MTGVVVRKANGSRNKRIQRNTPLGVFALPSLTYGAYRMRLTVDSDGSNEQSGQVLAFPQCYHNTLTCYSFEVLLIGLFQLARCRLHRQ